MGKPRGQRNAAREKAWPGADAADVRAFKRNGGEIDWLAVEQAANDLLPDLPPIDKGGCIFPETAVNLYGHDALPQAEVLVTKAERAVAISMMARPPAPLRDTPVVYKEPKNQVGNKCDRCGKPRGGFKPFTQEELAERGLTAPIYAGQKFYCAACYRLNAAERRERETTKILQRRAERLPRLIARRARLVNRHATVAADKAERMDGYIYWQERGSCVEHLITDRNYKGNVWELWLSFQPDFAQDVIEAIADVELAHDQPFVFIATPIDRDRKPLYFGNDGAKRVFEQRPEAPRIRYRRPKWKTLRGQWA